MNYPFMDELNYLKKNRTHPNNPNIFSTGDLIISFLHIINNHQTECANPFVAIQLGGARGQHEWVSNLGGFVQRLVDDRSIIQRQSTILNVGFVREGQCVLHPHLVVAVWVVLVGMRSTRLLASLSGQHLLARLVKQILKLERLDEVRVPDHAAVLDAHVLAKISVVSLN